MFYSSEIEPNGEVVSRDEQSGNTFCFHHNNVVTWDKTHDFVLDYASKNVPSCENIIGIGSNQNCNKSTVEFCFYFEKNPKGVDQIIASLKYHTSEVQIMFVKESFFATSHEDGKVGIFQINKKQGFPTFLRHAKFDDSESRVIVGFDCSKCEKYLFVAS